MMANRPVLLSNTDPLPRYMGFEWTETHRNTMRHEPTSHSVRDLARHLLKQSVLTVYAWKYNGYERHVTLRTVNGCSMGASERNTC